MAEHLSAHHDLAREALLEITAAESVGEFSHAEEHGDGVVTLYFRAALGGYRGWHWTVSIAQVEGFEPTVLETELTPGEGALLSPDWVPWADRMAEYVAAQEAAGEGESDDDDETDSDDADDADDDDFDDDDEFNGDDDDDDLDDDDDEDDSDDGGDSDEDADDDDIDDLDEHDLDGDPDDTVHDGDIDGVDIESAVSAAAELGVDEADEAEDDADGARPEKVRRPRRGRRQSDDEGDDPEG